MAGSNGLAITFNSRSGLYIVVQRSASILPSCPPERSGPVTKPPFLNARQVNCIHTEFSAGFTFEIAALAAAGSFR